MSAWFAGAVAAGLAHAGWVGSSGERVPDTPARKSMGAFGAHLVLVRDDQQLVQLWRTSSANVKIDAVDSIAVDGQAYAFIVFTGCTPNAAGRCDVTVQFRVDQPDGKVYATSAPMMEVWRDKPAPATRMLELSVRNFRVAVRPQDARGKYIVRADINDHVSGLSMELAETLTVRK